MAKLEFSSFVVITLCLVLIEALLVVNGGKTSSFVRKDEKTIDMPLDADVFQVPLGYNAPRQERVSNIAYNVINGLCNPVKDQSAPVYITIGDGGNLEGLATRMTEPQPAYSAYREASFGHAIFEIKNRTHSYYSWNRNQDGYAVEADSMWFLNRYWNPIDDSTTTADS